VRLRAPDRAITRRVVFVRR